METPPSRSIFVEWLVTNGLGSYAMGTVDGPPARSYHGLLVVARHPPVDRTVLVAGLEETVSIDGGPMIPLGAPVEVRLDGRRPIFRFDVDGLRIERTIWMAHRWQTTYVRYDVAGDREGLTGSASHTGRTVVFSLVPLVTERDHHALRLASDGIPDGSVRILAPGSSITAETRWVIGVRLPEETARGLADTEDLWAPVRVTTPPLAVGEHSALILTTESSDPAAPDRALRDARRRDGDLRRRARLDEPSPDDGFAARLVLAADAFIVRRALPAIPDGRSVIAGYPWFNDWGRDTMIALPGLCLATGRTEAAATILREFARFERDGLIPNDFPDDPAREPAYHTADASLWFILAVASYLDVTDDRAVLDELLPTVRSIVHHHLAGTRFGIGIDPSDGLLRAGAEGVQLTWMDAKVDDWVVTPRRGKPVELQALWIGALRRAAAWTGEGRLADAADRARIAFRERFWRPDLGHLLDVVDGPDGDDPALRPNQLLALALREPIVDGDVARPVLAAVEQELHVPLGLRSLAPTDPAYRPRYQGDRYARDAGYHQGTVWTWLIGPYADAVARFGGGPAAALDVLRPFRAHLDVAGLGSISEILEPEPPFTPRGAPFQAWGVAEVLRAWRAYGGE